MKGLFLTILNIMRSKSIVIVMVSISFLCGCSSSSSSSSSQSTKNISQITPLEPDFAADCVQMYIDNDYPKPYDQSLFRKLDYRYVKNDCLQRAPAGRQPVHVRRVGGRTFYLEGHVSSRSRGYLSKADQMGLIDDLSTGGGYLPQDLSMAAKLAEEFGAMGNDAALFLAGSLLISTKPKRAFEYTKREAVNNNCIAQAHLANLYFEGIGTDRNLVKAYFWALAAKTNPGNKIKISYLPSPLVDWYTSQDYDDRKNFGYYLGRRYALSPSCYSFLQFGYFSGKLLSEFGKRQVNQISAMWLPGEAEPIALNDIDYRSATSISTPVNSIKGDIKPASNDPQNMDVKDKNLNQLSQKSFTKHKVIALSSTSVDIPTQQIFKQSSDNTYSVHSARSQTEYARGKFKSGTAVAISENILISNCHIFEDSSLHLLEVGEVISQLKIISSDFTADTCILETSIVLQSFQTKFKQLKDLNVGENVIAIGNPSGLNKSISTGVISGIRKMNNISVIQTNAEISPGSSGGGLFDQKGNLIGITTFGFKGREGLNFAVALEEYLYYEIK